MSLPLNDWIFIPVLPCSSCRKAHAVTACCAAQDRQVSDRAGESRNPLSSLPARLGD